MIFLLAFRLGSSTKIPSLVLDLIVVYPAVDGGPETGAAMLASIDEYSATDATPKVNKWLST